MHEFLVAFPVLLSPLAAHGLAARRPGNRTVPALGRFTLNPVKHVDVVLAIWMPRPRLAGFGGKVSPGGANRVAVDVRGSCGDRGGHHVHPAAGVAEGHACVVTAGT